MATTYITNNIKTEQTTSKDASCVPSGFVLKLYQMVNEAPDEIIAWLPEGDAFRISNLRRLESETLPTFFRHRRFQSLVRQLNFYNFRKVNRERTFWVYRHSLFHRDRPEELHLLRRRTCPGVDGRKQRSDNDPSRSSSPRPTSSRRNYLSADDQSENDSVANIPGKKNKRKVRQPCEDSEMKRLKRKSHNIGGDHSFGTSGAEGEARQNFLDMSEVNSSAMQDQDSSAATVICSELPTHVVPPEGDDLKGPSGLPKRTVSPNIFGDTSDKKERSNSFEQSVLVGKVARKLEEHAKRAAAAKGICSKRRSGTVTPPYSSDTMKYHALTYDDEIEIFDSARGCVVERQQRVLALSQSDENLSVVSNDDEDRIKSVSFRRECNQKKATIPPVENNIIVADIVRKLHGWVSQSAFASKMDGQLAAAIAGFCMLTNPRDPSFEEKCMELMLACGSLVAEFRRYKSALLPGCLPLDVLGQTPARLEQQIQQLFSGDKSHTVRVFKVFLLNNLEDLVNDKSMPINVGLTTSEAESMHSCYKIWLTSLRHSS